MENDEPVTRVEPGAAAQARERTPVSGTPETSVPTTLLLLTIATRVPGPIMRGGPSFSVERLEADAAVCGHSPAELPAVSSQKRLL